MVTSRSVALISSVLLGCGVVPELLGVISHDAGAHADSGLDSGGSEAGEELDATLGNAAEAGETLDAQDAMPPCDTSKPFGAPVLLAELQSSGAEGGLRLLPDELSGFFWSTRPGGPGSANLYGTSRPDRTSPFGAITLLNNVNVSGTFQLDPSAMSNGLLLVFRSIRGDGGVGGDDLYSAKRADAGSDFSQVTFLSTLNSASNDVQPFLTADGSEIYFASNRAGDYDIYRATSQNGVYGTPSAVAELNQAGFDDADPVLSADRLTIFFSSTRPGGLGESDIWVATRTSTGGAFGPATNVMELNSSALDDPTWLSGDGCRLYLSIGDMPSTHQYLATRPQ